MNDKLERVWMESVMACYRRFSGICLAGLRKTMKNFRYVNVIWDNELKEAETGINSKQGTLLYICTFFAVEC
jgi:hypothetical protein